MTAAAIPEVLLSYQRDLIALTHANRVVVSEKSRRIGVTWGIALDSVLCAGGEKSTGGMDVLYIGYNKDLAREFVDTCAEHARSFSIASASVHEFLFDDGDPDKGIQAFRLEFASGFDIVALSSRPRSLRGRQGYVIIDEAAFHDELDELLKAALALLIWGGRVLVISTHDGADNPFAQLVAECRSGKRPYPVHRVTFDDALRAGLYKRICLVTGKTWSEDAERAWADEIRKFYGDAAGEELDCVPRQSGGKFLARTLLEARAVDVPVVTLALKDAFVDLSEEDRIRQIEDWCLEHLEPLLRAAAGAARSYLGEDFGRSGDLSVLWPLIVEQDLRRRTPFVVQLRNVPFRAQEQILFFICDRLPRFSGAALDARGNGQYLAEVTRQRYGEECVAEVMLSEAWYREHMPRLKSALEDDAFELPRDADIIDDFRSLEIVRGVARAPERARQTASGQRHGDAAIAACLANAASNTLDAGPLEATVAGEWKSLGAFGELGRTQQNFAGWNDR